MDKLLASLSALLKFLQESRLGAVTDPSAWLLMAPALGALYAIDPTMALTLLQWSIYGIALAGASVIISRIVFPQIKLDQLVQSAKDEKNTGAGLVAAATIAFVGVTMLALVMWAKA